MTEVGIIMLLTFAGVGYFFLLRYYVRHINKKGVKHDVGNWFYKYGLPKK